MTKIMSAAIKFRLNGETKFRIISGKSHANCIESFASLDYTASKRDMNNEVQGFITSDRIFVDRVKALEIAKKAKQVKSDYDKDELFSEFLIYR